MPAYRCLLILVIPVLVLVGCHAVDAARNSSHPSSGTNTATEGQCSADDIQLSVNPNSDDFDGSMHSGRYFRVALRTGHACRLPALPSVAFVDRTGTPLQTNTRSDASAKASDVTLKPGMPLVGSLRWVAGDAYGDGNCHQASTLRLTIAGKDISAPLNARLCAPSGKPADVQQRPLAPKSAKTDQ